MSNKIKLLIADDDPYILMSLEFLFQKNNFEVVIARNGTEALDLLHQHKPQLALLDIMMPDVDGYSICEFIKNSEEFNTTKVVFLSAKTNEKDIQKGYKLGADLFITKPFSTRTIIKQIQEVLDK